MKAFVKYGKEPGQAGLREAPAPEPGPGEVLLAVAGCGVCGSDLHAYRAAPGYDWVAPPVVLGHEFSGTVVRRGPGVEDVTEGDRVVAVGIQGCLKCPRCREGKTNLCANRKVIGLHMDGGMAEYAVVRSSQLVPVPNDLDLKTAALTEPLSVALHAVNAVRPGIGRSVVVSGPGPIGILAACLASWGGSRVLVLGAEADAAIRLPCARRLGLQAEAAVGDLDRVLGTALEESQADFWIESSGSPRALETALSRLKPGGTLLVVGMYSGEVPWRPTVSVRAEHRYVFSYASNFGDYVDAMRLLRAHGEALRALIDFFPLEQVEEAFDRARRAGTVKAILTPEGVNAP